MSRFTRYELIESSYPSIFATKTLACPAFFLEEDNDVDVLDFLNPSFSPFGIFDTVTDLTQIEHTPFTSTYKRAQRRVNSGLSAPLVPSEFLDLKSLSDRVSLLESSFERLTKVKALPPVDRKYTWSAEIDGADRKYKWTSEIKGGEKDKKKKQHEVGGVKNYKWTAEIEKKGHGAPILKNYTIKVKSNDSSGESSKLEKKKKEKKEKKNATRTVEIEEVIDDPRAIVLRQNAYTKRTINNRKGKRKELSPQDAAMMIQMSFRAYLIRRSQALRALRDLAIARTKLKEIRKLFNNFSYRRLIAHDAEEHQKFSERIIVLLLTVDAMDGVDVMVRAAKRSMVNELEAMLDVVDPQPAGRSLSMKRRTFDLPDSGIQKEIAAGVAQVVNMLNQEESGGEASTFEAVM